MATKRSRSTKPTRARRGEGLLQNKVFWITALIAILILFQVFVFQDEGVYTLIQLRKEIKDMETHISRLEIEKAQLESERDRLLNDPEYLERIARERFRMAKPGEKVFHVVIESKEATE